MSTRGGKREGAGRKKGVYQRHFSDHFSDEEVEKVIAKLKKDCMKDSKLLVFVAEQLFGKAPQRVEVTGEDGKPFTITIAREIAEQNA